MSEIIDKNQEVIEEIINDDLIISTENKDEYIEKDVYSLPAGRALTIEESYRVTSKEDTKRIVLIGPAAAGKTTIETSMYQRFYRGTSNNFLFAGSETLIAFEERARFTRASYQRYLPETERTPRGNEEIFLHLRLYNSKRRIMRNLLLADLAGEELQDYNGDTTTMGEKFGFIKYMDYIVGVIDGSMIIDRKSRVACYEELYELLRTICDANLVAQDSKILIVISKYDIVTKNIKDDLDRKNKTVEFINYMKKDLMMRLSRYVKSIEWVQVAAMPNNKVIDFPYGIDELIAKFLDDNIATANDVEQVKRDKNTFLSEFNKLGEKLLGDYHE